MDGTGYNSAELIRIMREDAGMTQERLCRKTGISRPTLANWEVGRTSPSLDNFVLIARATGYEIRIRKKEREFTYGK